MRYDFNLAFFSQETRNESQHSDVPRSTHGRSTGRGWEERVTTKTKPKPRHGRDDPHVPIGKSAPIGFFYANPSSADITHSCSDHSSSGDEERALLPRLSRKNALTIPSTPGSKNQKRTHRKFDGGSQQWDAQKPSVVGAPFQCGICCEDAPSAWDAQRGECGHLFCDECVEEYVRPKVLKGRYPIYCPLCLKDPGVLQPGGERLRSRRFVL